MPERETWVCRVYPDIVVSEFSTKTEGLRICGWSDTPLPGCRNCDRVLINYALLEKDRERRNKDWRKKQRT